MTETEQTTDNKNLKDLSFRYGIFMIIIVINMLIAAPLLISVMGYLNSDLSPDISYAVLLFGNEIASYLIPLSAAALLFRNELSFRKTQYPRFFGDSILIFIAGITAGSLGSMLTKFVTSLFNTGTAAAFSSSMPRNTFCYIVFLICVTVIAPICEEIIFRRYLLMPLRKYGDFTAAIVSSVIFGLYHFNADQLMYTMILGFFLSLMAVRSGSIVPSTILHTANNVIVGIALYAPETFGNEDFDKAFKVIQSYIAAAADIMFYVGFAALILISALKVFSLKRNSELTYGEQLATFIKTPVFIIGLVLTMLFFIISVIRQ